MLLMAGMIAGGVIDDHKSLAGSAWDKPLHSVAGGSFSRSTGFPLLWRMSSSAAEAALLSQKRVADMSGRSVLTIGNVTFPPAVASRRFGSHMPRCSAGYRWRTE